MPALPIASRRLSRTNRRSMISAGSVSDDEDAITPCSSPPPTAGCNSAHPPPAAPTPTPEPAESHHHYQHRRGSAWSDQLEACKDGEWHFDPAEGERMDDEHLWRRMLAIQREFHCYNSARMSAALEELEMGIDAGACVPSRTCLKLMNDSISEIPEEAKRQLDQWLHPGDGSEASTKPVKSAAVRAWRRTFHGNSGFRM